jgi:hypothetical protein
MPVMGIPIAIAVAGAAAAGASAYSSNAQKTAAKNAEALAREQQGQALTEQQRLEEKYGLTQGELAREQRLLGIPQGDEAIKFSEGQLGLEAKQQSALEQRAGMSGEELLKSVGPDTRQLLDTIAQRSGMTGEELFKAEGAIPTALQEQILKEAQNPGGNYTDTLNLQLEQARQMVNAEANKRGVFGGSPEGGIRFENLGRAGVDLAIKSATEKEAARQQDLSNASTLASLFQNLSAGARGEQATVSQQGLTEQTGARNELQQFLAMMENASANAKGRASSVATGASNTAQNTMGQSYQDLIGLEGYKGNIQGPVQGGLNAIGSIAADYAGGLSTAKKTTATPSTYDELMKNQNQDNNQFDTLGGLSGSELVNLKKQYPNLFQ